MKDNGYGNVKNETLGNMLAGAHVGRAIGVAEQYADSQCNGIGRQSLRDSIFSRASHAQQAADESHRLKRLMDLADKHPEVFEMFELMRSLNLF